MGHTHRGTGRRAIGAAWCAVALLAGCGASGDGAEEWLGRRVVAVANDALGGIAEYATAPVGGVFDAPAQLDDLQAAAFLLPFHTTHLALSRRGGLRSGETLSLIHI